MILLEAAGMYLEKYSHLHMCALSKTLASLVYTAQFTMSDIDIYGRLFLILSEYIYYIILFFFSKLSKCLLPKLNKMITER